MKSPSGIAALIGIGGLVVGALAVGTDEEESQPFAIGGVAVGVAGLSVSLFTFVLGD